jgi:hypothetical protein
VTFLRWTFGLVPMGLITAGAVFLVHENEGKFDANFYGILLVALLPPLVYLLGVRRRSRATMVCGASLLGVTALGWSSIFQQDAMRAVGAAFAFFITFLISIICALEDRRLRHGR